MSEENERPYSGRIVCGYCRDGYYDGCTRCINKTTGERMWEFVVRCYDDAERIYVNSGVGRVHKLSTLTPIERDNAIKFWWEHGFDPPRFG